MEKWIQKTKDQENQNENRNISAWCKHWNGEINTHKTQVGRGYLSMILNQRQLTTPASDWEPYQAKGKTQHRKRNIDKPTQLTILKQRQNKRTKVRTWQSEAWESSNEGTNGMSSVHYVLSPWHNWSGVKGIHFNCCLMGNEMKWF